MIKYYFAKPEEWVIWFDLDDTLWDFRTNSHETLGEVFDQYKLNRFWKDKDKWSIDYHKVNDPLWGIYAKGLISQNELRKKRFYDSFINGGMQQSEANKIAEEADIFYLENLGKKTKIVDGARNLLRDLKSKGFKIGILSNGFADIQKMKASSGGLINFIDILITSDIYGFNKPDSRLFRQAEKLSNISSNRCIMIGDNDTTDIVGALKANWALAIWFNPNKKTPSSELTDCLTEECSLQIVTHLNQIIL